jgi:hypothetical protein
MVLGCENNNKKMNVNVHIKNFKKGNIYLQKISDSLLINVDSIFVKNDTPIKLSYNIESPELFYLNLDVSKIDNRIEFFGEKGEINIESSLEKFNSDFKVSGSSSDSIYRDYLSVIRKFNNNTLDLLELSFKFSKLKLKDSLEIVQNKLEALNKRQYLFNLNYAVNNGNSFISPLIAINEFSQSSKILLDTIKSTMSKEVIESKYGKIFESIREKKSK